MQIRYHPEFWDDLQRGETDYALLSIGLRKRFRDEVLAAVSAITASPESAGHYLNTGRQIIREFRRRNLRAFPYFVLYGASDDSLIIGALIPTRSDPVNWLSRFPIQHP